MTAADHGHDEMCRWLLTKGADVNAAMETTGWTAVHAAAKSNNRTALKVLLEAGGDPLMEASHRDFGRKLTAADVTKDPETVAIIGRSRRV